MKKILIVFLLSLSTRCVSAQDTVTPTTMIVGLDTFSMVDTLSLTFEFPNLNNRYTVQIIGDDALRKHCDLQGVPISCINVTMQYGVVIKVERRACKIVDRNKRVKILRAKVIYEAEPNALSIDRAFLYVRTDRLYSLNANYFLEHQWFTCHP